MSHHSDVNGLMVQFFDPDGRKVTECCVSGQYGWESEQYISVARLRLKEYKLKAIIQGTQYVQIPEENRMAYEVPNQGYALWCSTGEHAFSPEDKGRKRATVTEYDDENGQPREVVKLMCGPCAQASGFMQPRKAVEPAKALQAADPELYAEFLEWKNGMRDEPVQ